MRALAVLELLTGCGDTAAELVGCGNVDQKINVAVAMCLSALHGTEQALGEKIDAADMDCADECAGICESWYRLAETRIQERHANERALMSTILGYVIGLFTVCGSDPVFVPSPDAGPDAP
jgi:hypothetical protein